MVYRFLKIRIRILDINIMFILAYVQNKTRVYYLAIFFFLIMPNRYHNGNDNNTIFLKTYTK
jgi:hypothetical protein